VLQEMKLTPKSKTPVFQNYILVRKDRPTGGGRGLAFLVHHLVRFTNTDVTPLIPLNDLDIELQGISILINNTHTSIFNVYIPPASANPGYSPDIKRLLELDGDSFILGNLNAHHISWFSNVSHGHDSLAQQIEDSNFFILNSNSQTCFPTRGGPFSLDISLVSDHLALAVSWSTNVTLNSDHLPISITFEHEDGLPP
jgi:hypothetical protein